MSDDELAKIVEELQKEFVPEDSILRSVVSDLFGPVTIFVLQCQQLLWPLLVVTSNRMRSYSPHIQK